MVNRAIHIAILSVVCCGCVSSPVEIPPWDITPATVEVQRPLPLPELPAPTSSTEDTVTFTIEGFSALLAYAAVAGGNVDIALENAAALEAQSQAYNSLAEAGKLQRQFTLIREEQLAIERRDHLIDNWVHRAIIAIGLLGAAL